jgi:hypothetical protein
MMALRFCCKLVRIGLAGMLSVTCAPAGSAPPGVGVETLTPTMQGFNVPTAVNVPGITTCIPANGPLAGKSVVHPAIPSGLGASPCAAATLNTTSIGVLMTGAVGTDKIQNCQFTSGPRAGRVMIHPAMPAGATAPCQATQPSIAIPVGALK